MIAKQVFAGLDLGAVSDFTALVVFDVERIPDPDRTGISRGQPPRTVNEFGITWIKRWPLLTPYPEMVAELQRMYSITPRLQNGTLIVDGTGVGRPVVEMIVQARLPTTVRPYSITAGRNPNENPEPGCFPTVPKLDLVGSVSAVLQQRRIKLADPAAVKLGPLLMKELGTFKVKTDDVTRNETFGCFVTGTLIETRRGQIPIESVKQDDSVLTRVGYRRVLWSGVTKYTRSLAEVRLSNGSVLRGTPDHLVWTGNRGWVELAGLREGDRCFPSNLQSTAARRLLLDSAAPVFDLSVDGQPEFFANGVLCHNSFRDGENDDCVLAAALAIWYAEYHAYRQPGLAGIGLPPPGQTLLPPSMGKMKPGNFPFGKPGEKGGPYG